MPSIIKYYVNTIDYISLKTGRATMYLVFVMMFILILSFVTRNIINIPLIWIIEMAQFVMTGYYLLGGGYSMLTCLLYTSPSPRDVSSSRMPSSA